MYMSGWIQANQRSTVHLPQTKLGRENWQSYQLISFPVDGYCVDTISDPFACSNKKGKKNSVYMQRATLRLHINRDSWHWIKLSQLADFVSKCERNIYVSKHLTSPENFFPISVYHNFFRH